MREFDVFIEKPLTEADVLIYSIPFRDGITASNRIILETMLDYYTLQKAVALKNNIALVSRIDEILLTIRERISSCIAIDSSADFLKKTRTGAQNNLIEISNDDINLYAQSFFKLRNAIGIESSNDVEAITKSVLKGIESEIEIDNGSLHTDLKSFMGMDGSLLIKSSDIETKKHSFEHISNKIALCSKPFNIFYSYRIGIESAMAIACDVLKYEIHYTLGSGHSEIVIDSPDVEAAAIKREKISSEIQVFSELVETLIYCISVNNQIGIGSSASVGLKRKRWVREVKNLNRSEVGEMSLQEFFYVTLV